MFNRTVKFRSAGHVFMGLLPRLEVALVPVNYLKRVFAFHPLSV